ncbi:MAG: hypothetical protein ACR2IE_09340 [Candidatus Sumerlaeaceae bacterium]
MAKKPYDEEDDEVEEEREVGPCRNCQFFDVDRDDEDATDDTLAPCLHPDLEEYDLMVSGDSGCNLFEPYEGADEDEEDEDEDEEEEEEEEEY